MNNLKGLKAAFMSWRIWVIGIATIGTYYIMTSGLFIGTITNPTSRDESTMFTNNSSLIGDSSHRSPAPARHAPGAVNAAPSSFKISPSAAKVALSTDKVAPPSMILLQVFHENRRTSAGKVHRCNADADVKVVDSGDLRLLRDKTDAVMFLGNYGENISKETVTKLMEIHKEKESVNSSQLWIYNIHESPFYLRIDRATVHHLPVHTMKSYFLTAGIHILYGHYQPGKPMPGYENEIVAAESLNALMKRKSKLAVWVSSHCKNKNWPRMEFVESIQQHMEVDMYGKCGNLTCEPRESVHCITNIFLHYKFIFGFENSECDDYITEKAWTPLINGIVPVVYGPRKASYIKQAPPNSFIYAGDFNSTVELADYLIFLDKNPDEYRKYFEWRSKGTVKRWNPPDALGYCNIPKMIRQVSEGKLKKLPLIETPFYNSCKPRKEHLVSKEGYLNLTNWEPWN